MTIPSEPAFAAGEVSQSPLQEAPPSSTAAPQELLLEQPGQDSANNTATIDDDDDDMTIIGLDQDPEQGNNDQQSAALAWIEQNGPEMEERRRNVLLRELQRVQRASFIHFILLCLIPTSLLFIVVATVLGEDEACESDATTCATEPRTFINAFTTRCICDAIDVSDRQN
jgi:hypothetical protein